MQKAAARGEGRVVECGTDRLLPRALHQGGVVAHLAREGELTARDARDRVELVGPVGHHVGREGLARLLGHGVITR